MVVFDGGAADPDHGTEFDAREATLVRLQVDGGEIAYYRKKKRFVAYCNNPNHGKCELTRHMFCTGEGDPNGRPVGAMLSWLYNNCDFNLAIYYILPTILTYTLEYGINIG